MRGESGGKGISGEEGVRVNWGRERMWIEWGRWHGLRKVGLFGCKQGIMITKPGMAIWSSMTELFASWVEDF